LRARWSAAGAVLPGSARSSLRTRWPTPAALSGVTRPSAAGGVIIVARPPVSRDAAPHALAPRACAEGVHHHAGLTDGTACSASPDCGVAGQSRAAWWRVGMLERCGEVPIWLDTSLRRRGSVRGRRHLWGAGIGAADRRACWRGLY
jgi:hypothetical protein